MRRELPPEPGTGPLRGLIPRQVERVLVGQEARLSVCWQNAGGATVAAETRCLIDGPGGRHLEMDASSDGAGGFSAAVTPDAPGQWWFAFRPGGGYSGYVRGVLRAAAS